jgi:signal transduction histidine kinase
VRTRLAWLLAGISGLCAVADTIVVSAFQPLLSEATIAVHGWPLVNLAALGSAVMGALVVTRYPRHPIGWLLNVIGVTTSISVLAESYSIWVVDEGGPGAGWAGEGAGVVAAMLGGPVALSGLAVMFLLAPDGHFLSRRWRYVGALAVLGLLLFVVGLANETPSDIAGRGRPEDVGTVASTFITVGVLAITIALLSAVGCMVIRLRRSEGEGRQQLRWVVVAASAVGVGLVWLVVGEAITGGEQTWATAVPLQVSFFLLPVCLAVAVLRYRLYDVDVIINRAVIYGVSTLVVATGYVVLVVGVGGLLGSRADGFWPSVVATAVVAMAFQPLRRRVVKLADRLAYGARAAPYDALSDFSRRVGHSPAPESLLPAVAEAAGQAVSAHEVRVMLDVEHGPLPTGMWIAPGATPLAVDVDALVMVTISDPSGRLGEMSVRLRPGRTVRPHEMRLLTDIAEHAALAFRNARLQAELAARVAMLDESTAQIAASRLRLIEAGDAERRRLEGAISREVTPLLSSLAVDLGPAPEGGRPAIDSLVERATAALDALRELTRGIFPTILTRSGLGPALSAFVARLGRPGVLAVDGSVTGRRFPARTEAAAYFCCTQAVTGSGDAHVSLAVVGGHLQVEVTRAAAGAMDLAAVEDRVEARGGTLELADDGTRPGVVRLLARLPVADDPDGGLTRPTGQRLPAAAAHSWTSRSGPNEPLGT